MEEYKKYKVYLLIFPNGKKYCGFTSKPLTRRWDNGNGYVKCPLVYRAIQKYGWENISKELLFSSSEKEEALLKEASIIAELELMNLEKGYNLHKGGHPTGAADFLTEEGRQKLRDNMNKIWNDPVLREKRIASMQGCKHSFRTKEHCKKLGEAHVGKLPVNAKAVAQINLETKEEIFKYESATKAAKEIGHEGGASNILKVCKGVRPTAYGFGWRFDNGK